jgi:hypothetical protein
MVRINRVNRVNKVNIEINEDRVKRLGKIIQKLGYKAISFDSPDLFPEDDEFIYSNYVFFLVAIDHRTHPEPKRFEAFVGGKFYHGSDLMYFLARRAQENEPDLFTAKKMIKITEKDVARIFSVGDVTIKDPAERALLLRDCAKRLIDSYEGDLRNLLKSSEGYLLRSDKIGVLQQLRKFQAYKDPLTKKSYLLVKILRRQGYFEPADIENLSFPVDNILMEVALRTGLVEAYALQGKIARKEQLNEKEVEYLRNATREVFEMVSRASNIPPDVLDDLIWTFGREVNKIVNEGDLKNIRTPLDGNIEHKRALEDFLVFIGGFDGCGFLSLRKLKLPKTWYF